MGRFSWVIEEGPQKQEAVAGVRRLESRALQMVGEAPGGGIL